VKQESKNPFKGRQFTAELILWAVRWYLQFPISSRDLERMLADRGITVDHTTPFRWIQAYAPELDKRIRPHLQMGSAQGLCSKPRQTGRSGNDIVQALLTHSY
jgi:IS6 family transposase